MEENMKLHEKVEIITSIINAVGTIIGAVGAIAAIGFGLYQINSTLVEQKFSNRLELADNLMSEYISLSEYASKATYYLVADANGESDELIKTDYNYPNYVQMHSEALENIKGKIAAYGSAELVYLFFDSYNEIQVMMEKGDIDFESYKNYLYSMPLIASSLRYDLTGENINPSVFYDSFMRELKLLELANGMNDFHKKMISTNNELVKKYNLSKEFIWNETL